MTRARPIAHSLLLIGATIALGLIIRRAPPGLPFVVVKFGGSMLWAMMIYWIVSTIAPIRSAIACGGIAMAIAALVELFKRYHAPSLDAFRVTLPGMLLLGRVFSVADLIFYAHGIAIGMGLDRLIYIADG